MPNSMTPLTLLQRVRRFMIGPVMRVVIGSVALSLALVLASDTAFKLLRNDAEVAREVRKRVSENVAIQIAVLESKGDFDSIKKTIDDIMRHEPSVRSIGVRQLDGKLVFKTTEHDRYWPTAQTDQSIPTHVKVPLWEGSNQWGHVEIGYEPVYPNHWTGWLLHPHVLMIASVAIAGIIVFAIYFRRVLKQLDPAQAIPERVKLAMDLLTDGVMILDQFERVMLTNRAAETMLALSPGSAFGRPLSTEPWVTTAFGANTLDLPWRTAMATRHSLNPQLIELRSDSAHAKQLLISAAPVIDAKGKVRGCFVNLTDVTTLKRMNDELQAALKELEQSHQQIENKNQQLQKAAQIDALTGALNRRALFEYGEKLFSAARAERTKLACIMVDIDKFKSINDTYGHIAGDQVIVQFARIIQRLMRPGDLLGRYGGEEFCVLLPGADAQHAAVIAERLRTKVAADCGEVVRSAPGLQITASFGVSDTRFGALSLQALMEEADNALYEAKNAGRNYVCVVSQTSSFTTGSATRSPRRVAAPEV